MGISRESRHKRRSTGGKRAMDRKKRKFEMGRQPAMTKLVAGGEKRVHEVRGRGNNTKYRALRLDGGNFSWGSEVCSRKTRILDVMYNASNNELLRTKTLVKNCIVLVDAAPFRTWYENHYGVEIGKKKGGKKAAKKGEEVEDVKKSNHVLRKLRSRASTRVLDPTLDDQFGSGRILACISSRPGQSGRADGYLLEGPELNFDQRKINEKSRK
jgi:small subunit ribosomal protein S8e